MQKSSFSYNHATSPVYTFGKGKSILLVLHGWGSSISSWQPLLESLDANRFTSYFLELPGFGASKEPNKAWKVDDYLHFVKAFVETLELKPEFLLVHSFGGRIAIKWLVQKDCPIKKTIFMGAAGIKPELTFSQKISKKIAPYFKKISKAKFIKPVYKFLQKLVYKFHGSGDYLKVKGVMKKTFLNVIDEDLTDLLSQIKQPARLLWGENDSYTPLWMGNLMKQKIPNSEIFVIPEARHGLHLTHRDIVLNHIQDYYTDI